MGGHPWFYFVKYQADVTMALQELREREFKAGRYNPSEWFPSFPVNPNHAPGCKHASIEEAMEDADADGTRSILDIQEIGDTPGYGIASAFPKQRLVELFGTGKPTRAQIESSSSIFENIERGQGIFIIAYDRDKPSEIFFAGYSYD